MRPPPGPQRPPPSSRRFLGRPGARRPCLSAVSRSRPAVSLIRLALCRLVRRAIRHGDLLGSGVGRPRRHRHQATDLRVGVPAATDRSRDAPVAAAEPGPENGSGDSEENAGRSKKGRGDAVGQERGRSPASVPLTPDDDGHGQESDAHESADEGPSDREQVAPVALGPLGRALATERRRSRWATGGDTVAGRHRHSVLEAQRRRDQGQHQRGGADQPGTSAPSVHKEKAIGAATGLSGRPLPSSNRGSRRSNSRRGLPR